MLLLILACRAPEPEPAPWEPPTFPGDGLPDPAATPHDTARGDTGGTGDDTGGTTAPELQIADALFTWFDYGGYGLIGYLVLLTESITCSDLVSYGSYRDGVYFYLYPPDDVETLGWASGYPACGQSPCNQAFYLLGGAFGYLDAGVTIEEYDAHYLTASWRTEVSDGDALRFYNCGDSAFWY